MTIQDIIDLFKQEKVIFPIYQEKELILTDIENEQWKEIDGFNYSISNYGRIKNNTTGNIKSLRNGIWGYQVNLWNRGKGKMFTISRLVGNYFIREVKPNERVMHKDGDRNNNYYKNLKIV